MSVKLILEKDEVIEVLLALRQYANRKNLHERNELMQLTNVIANQLLDQTR